MNCRRAETVELLNTLFDVVVVVSIFGGLLRVVNWLTTSVLLVQMHK